MSASSYLVDLPYQSLMNVYDQIEGELKEWQGGQPTVLPMPDPNGKFPEGGVSKIGEKLTERSIWWGGYHVGSPKRGLREFLKIIPLITPTGSTPIAIDIGCGNSASTFDLLLKGWKVIFVDYSIDCLAHLKHEISKITPFDEDRVEFVCTSIEDYEWPPAVDLVIASDALPYFSPGKVLSVLEKIHRALRVGGAFVGNFFSKSSGSEFETFINVLSFRRMGGWYIKDESSVRTILKSEGYDIKFCETGGTWPTVIAFAAIKKAGEKATFATQARRLRNFTPKCDKIGYWYYFAKNKTRTLNTKDIQTIKQAETTLGKESYNRQSVYGWTALHVAVLASNRIAIPFFLSKEADPKIPDSDGLSAIDYARLYNPELLVLFHQAET